MGRCESAGRIGLGRRAVLTALAVMGVISLFVVPVYAQREGGAFRGSFITPFPDGGVYRVLVVGDSLADGLRAGLDTVFKDDPRIEIIRSTFRVNGLNTRSSNSQIRRLSEELNNQTVHVAVVMLGAWDRVRLRGKSGKRVRVGTPEWKQEYAARGDRLMKVFKRRNIGVYWVGLPTVRRWNANEDARMMNGIVRERVYLNGLRFIDSFRSFSDERGGYSAFGPDLTGKIRRLRAGDGVYFTWAGYQKLAHFVERDLRRDISRAKAERMVPLAGTPEDQAKINPGKAKLASQKDSNGEKAEPGSNSVTEASRASSGGQKADNGRINLKIIGASGREEVVRLDIVRPAIPASIVALVTRRESSERLSQLGQPVLDQIDGGLTVMSTVTLAAGSASGGRARLVPSQTPYYRVLFKGERLKPRKGRADDVAWPLEPAPPEAAFLPTAPEPKASAKPKKAGKSRKKKR